MWYYSNIAYQIQHSHKRPTLPLLYILISFHLALSLTQISSISCPRVSAGDNIIILAAFGHSLAYPNRIPPRRWRQLAAQ
ncbi:hypothetical protein C8R48DRAFT_726006 [Suillus tomentosus]|nr:hypothetical protein C8R48DRAFT_726006 [Suillus tomentosus]